MSSLCNGVMFALLTELPAIMEGEGERKGGKEGRAREERWVQIEGGRSDGPN